MLNRVLRFKLDEKALSEEVKTICQDKSISLEDRWLLFTTSEFGERENYVQDFDVLNEIFGTKRFSWYDIFYKDRYAVVNMPEIVEGLEESTWHPEYDKDFKTEKEWLAEEIEEGAYGYKVSRKQINALKEEILEKFILSFTNDW